MSTCCSSVSVNPKDTKRLSTITDGLLFHTSGTLPRLSPFWKPSDRMGAFKVRLGLGRNRYAIPAGLYALGEPDGNSPVLVTANYKLTVDHVRRACGGMDAFVLVLDTRGVNVWCAAGKGTFGTEELVGRIESTRLGLAVKHRTLILPQLGATGIRAREIKERTGFSVVWGPVRITDLKTFMADGLKATPAMRAVTFTLKERLAVTPTEFVQSWTVALPLAGLAVILGLIKFSSFAATALSSGMMFLAAILAGTLLFPALLPLLPGRSFVIKGLLLGAVAGALTSLLMAGSPIDISRASVLAAPITSFLALNFTGATSFASVSGVKREIRRGIPAIVVMFAAGLALAIIF